MTDLAAIEIIEDPNQKGRSGPWPMVGNKVYVSPALYSLFQRAETQAEKENLVRNVEVVRIADHGLSLFHPITFSNPP